MDTREPSAVLTTLTAIQRRRRTWTVTIIVIIAIMLIAGLTHPFFKLAKPASATRAAQKALAVKGLLVMSYWTVCLLLAVALLLIAWMEYREIQRKALIARRNVWREIADKTRESR